MKPLSALILGAPNIVSMGIARGWMMAGHKIAAIWYPERLTGTKSFAQDRALAERAPGVTMHGIAARSGVATRAVPPLTSWSAGLNEIQALEPDVILSILFLDRIPPAVLDAYANRVLNLHPSMLPAYRGAAPIFNMLWDRTIDRHSGMTLHLVTPAFDRGDILGQTPVPYPEDRNLTAYYMQLVKAGTTLVTENIPRFISGTLTPTPQPDTPAPQGARNLNEAILTSAQSADEIAWLCATIPQMTALRVTGTPASVTIKRFAEILGPNTNAPPKLGGAYLEMDAQDRRIRLETQVA